MNTRRISPQLAMCVLAILVALGAQTFFSVSTTLGGDGANEALGERLDRIEKRLDDLERIVNDDPMYPRRTLTARVDALEDSLEKFEKVGKDDKRTDQRSFDDLEKRLEQQAKVIDALARRVADIEKHPPDDDDVQRELQAQSRQIDQLGNALQSLKQRIERLERER